MHFSTVVYCLLSGGVGVAASLAYFRGVELPRRIKRYGKDRVGGGGGERGELFSEPFHSSILCRGSTETFNQPATITR